MNSKVIKYFEYKDLKLPVKIISDKRCRRINISINNKYIRISKPIYVSLKSALNFLSESSKKVYDIYKKLNQNLNYEDEFKEGMIILYHGEEKILKIEYIDKNYSYINIENEYIVLNLSVKYKGIDNKDINLIFKECFKAFLKEDTKYLLENRLNYWCNVLKEIYNRVSIKCQKTVWGSAVSKSKNLNFNMKIAMLPKEASDYIIVHELCHFKEPNHSSKFWNLVQQYIPNYKEIKLYLKNNMRYFDII